MGRHCALEDFMRPSRSLRSLVPAAAVASCLFLLAACGQSDPASSGPSAVSGAGAAGAITAAAGAGGALAAAGAPGSGGIPASAGAPGSSGSASQLGSAGASGGSGAGAPGTAGAAGASDPGDPPAPRPINIKPGGGCNCDLKTNGQTLAVDTRLPIQGKLVITLGGICGGPGGCGLEGTAKALGFHVFQVATQTCVNSAPQKYKDIIAKTPDDAEANRQVGDARMELWDGVDRVDWVTVATGESIVARTEAALKYAAMQDPGGDWGYYLDADGHVRWTDVFLLGYSWGSQTIAMVSKYVRLGRVFCTSGPQAEGFPNATWITHPSATPVERLYMAVGFDEDYPSMDKVDTAPNTVTSMIETVLKAGWVGPPKNVHPGDVGPYTGLHVFPMIAKYPYDAHAPGGHGIFCNNDPQSGWAALCKYAFGVK